MAKPTHTISRKEQILQTLAAMLEAAPGGRITTAALAREVGVSEAALYRHFPSKAKMYEGLIEYTEDALFSRVSRIMQEATTAQQQCHQILTLLLGFAEHNPGLTLILTGEALTGEHDRLRQRVVQLFERLETQLRQILRNAELTQKQRTEMPIGETASLLLAVAEGRISQFVRSQFRKLPLSNWDAQWTLLEDALFCTQSE